MDLDNAKDKIEKATGILPAVRRFVSELGKTLKSIWWFILLVLLVWFFYEAFSVPLDNDIEELDDIYNTEY